MEFLGGTLDISNIKRCTDKANNTWYFLIFHRQHLLHLSLFCSYYHQSFPFMGNSVYWLHRFVNEQLKALLLKCSKNPLIFVLKANLVSCKTKHTWCPGQRYSWYLEQAKGFLHGMSSVVFCSFASLYSCEENQRLDQAYSMYSSNET